MIRLTGVKEIDDVLRGLPLQVNDKILQAANASAAKYLVDREKLLAPEGPTGNLVDSIGIVRGGFGQVQSGRRSIGQVTIGPRRGGKYKGFAGHLVEFGTKARYTKGTGKKRKVVNAYRGIMKSNPFAELAFDQTKNIVLGSINEQLGKSLISYMKRTIKNR